MSSETGSHHRHESHSAPAQVGDGTGLRCRFCPGQEFRRSRFRASDLWGLLALRYPVRCLRCRQRQKMSVFAASKAESSKARAHQAPEPAETWRNWTVDSKPAVVQKPEAPVPVPQLGGQPTARTQPITAQSEPTRIKIVAPKKDDDENAIW
jgi:hypothetical protein